MQGPSASLCDCDCYFFCSIAQAWCPPCSILLSPASPSTPPCSAAMTLFYVWNLLLFKPNLPAKLK